MPGVNVMVKGSDKITSTNNRGEFQVKNVQTTTVLIVSSVGYRRQEVAVNNRTDLRIQLKVAVGTLDEIQFVAYGTVSKRLNTGNVASVKADNIEKQPVNNPLLAMQGRVPGLFITQTTGMPGGGVTVRIQGQNSIANGNDPLYVIDGVPMSANWLRKPIILKSRSDLYRLNTCGFVTDKLFSFFLVILLVLKGC